ncbi:hypothetical protein HK097_007894 [Rhizophlyctis rosea]|uniref:Uncharacterized protein n=1 Tax=Rhizophlyctis rosea TaxID=64517 RepID=A0AAD5X5L1_9FUNG|nr:hypothetical protein HK097_007894 [Rhizophlyctis rosea]
MTDRLTQQPPLGSFIGCQIYDWGGEDLRKTTAYKLIAWRKQKKVAMVSVKKEKNRAMEHPFKLLKMIRAGHEAVLRSTWFLLRVNDVTMTNPAEFIPETETLNFLLFIISNAQVLSFLQLGRAQWTEFDKKFLSGKPVGHESLFNRFLEDYVNARTEEEVTTAMKALMGNGFKPDLVEVEMIPLLKDNNDRGFVWMRAYFDCKNPQPETVADSEGLTGEPCNYVLFFPGGDRNEVMSKVLGVPVEGKRVLVVRTSPQNHRVFIDLADDWLEGFRSLPRSNFSRVSRRGVQKV